MTIIIVTIIESSQNQDKALQSCGTTGDLMKFENIKKIPKPDGIIA